jgi:hypothetical protein
MIRYDDIIVGGLRVGDIIHLDPRAFPELVIISEKEAKAIADADTMPRRQFVCSWQGEIKK